jgi:hypothetical protein
MFRHKTFFPAANDHRINKLGRIDDDGAGFGKPLLLHHRKTPPVTGGLFSSPSLVFRLRILRRDHRQIGPGVAFVGSRHGRAVAFAH